MCLQRRRLLGISGGGQRWPGHDSSQPGGELGLVADCSNLRGRQMLSAWSPRA